MEESPFLILAGDIGATKTDLGLYRCDESFAVSARPLARCHFPSCNAPELLSRIREFLQQEISGEPPAAVCLGVAGPVSEGRVTAINLGLELDEGELRRELECPHLVLVNDLYAAAFGLSEPESCTFEVLQVGEEVCGGMVGVLAPGTGLGMALLRSGNPPLVLASEGGHCDFAPRDEAEIDLWRYLKEHFGHVSRERLISGPGLLNIYHWCRGMAPVRGRGLNAASVVEAAAIGETEAGRAMEMFVSLLGATAGDLALQGLTRGGICLAGGIPPRIIEYLRREIFLESFRDKGRMRDWLAKIPVKVILDPCLALNGAARIAASLLSARPI
ncbi:MAG: glucokinase [Deltaproteobacteria bacterium]|nr:glucokinase [Deltaproteobacteria bacterium]